MRRREFISLLGAGATALPLAGRAQRLASLPVIGLVSSKINSAPPRWIAAFQKRLGELGWIDGQTVTIDYRWADGRPDHFDELLADLVQRKVDVIVTGGNAVLPAKRATSTIPIVFAVAVDPVESGYVESLARPGGNVTGFSLQSEELAAKRIELLREVFPNLHSFAVLANVGYPAALREMGEVQSTARALGVDVASLELRRPEDIVPAFEGLKAGAVALYVCTDALVSYNIARINGLALSARLAAIWGSREFLAGGGLISYGASFSDLYRRSAELVDKILHGAKPSELPVEQPTKFDLVVNLQTAKTLGLTISPLLLARADEVIE
jgi:putative tryptophan/tyrosine transport system substrate-binding protein